MILKLKLDVTKIDKTRLFKGAKGVYLDATVLLKDAPDQYGNDGMIVQDLGKDARESGQKGAILGNAKWVVGQGPDAKARQQPQSKPATTQAEIDAKWEQEDEEVPF